MIKRTAETLVTGNSKAGLLFPMQVLTDVAMTKCGLNHGSRWCRMVVRSEEPIVRASINRTKDGSLEIKYSDDYESCTGGRILTKAFVELRPCGNVFAEENWTTITKTPEIDFIQGTRLGDEAATHLIDPFLVLADQVLHNKAEVARR